MKSNPVSLTQGTNSYENGPRRTGGREPRKRPCCYLHRECFKRVSQDAGYLKDGKGDVMAFESQPRSQTLFPKDFLPMGFREGASWTGLRLSRKKVFFHRTAPGGGKEEKSLRDAFGTRKERLWIVVKRRNAHSPMTSHSLKPGGRRPTTGHPSAKI